MICSIITLFFPNEENVKNVQLINEQVDKVILCDNSPNPNKLLFDKLDGIAYYSFDKNYGLSAAFNYILKSSKESFSDDDYVIFFDQDSTIEPNHIQTLVGDYEKLLNLGHKVGCIGPIFFNKNSGKVEIQTLKKELIPSVFSVKSIITSSMLCRFGDLKKVDFWNEDVFLDMADWDLCWRFLKKGYLCCVTKSVILSHCLGENSKKIGLIHLKIGKPFRNYYQVREGLYLMGKSYTPFKFKLRFLMMFLFRNPLRLLLLEDRKEQFFYMKKGVLDWKAHKKGTLTETYEIEEKEA